MISLTLVFSVVIGIFATSGKFIEFIKNVMQFLMIVN